MPKAQKLTTIPHQKCHPFTNRMSLPANSLESISQIFHFCENSPETLHTHRLDMHFTTGVSLAKKLCTNSEGSAIENARPGLGSPSANSRESVSRLFHFCENSIETSQIDRRVCTSLLARGWRRECVWACSAWSWDSVHQLSGVHQTRSILVSCLSPSIGSKVPHHLSPLPINANH